jgi:hypothetical protein
MTFATNPDLQIEVDKLARALSELSPGEMLSYEEMSGILGYEIKDKPWVLMKAKKRVETTQRLRFGTVRGEGTKKLAANELASIGVYARKKIGRVAKYNAGRLTDLGYNDIDNRIRARVDAERSLLGAIAAVASTKGDHVASITKTGPIVAAAVFDYVRPQRLSDDEAEAA